MENKIKAFWRYFEQQNFALHLFYELEPEIREEQFRMLEMQLDKYCSGISFLIEGGFSVSRLTLTAAGDPCLYEAVELLSAGAPQLRYWEIQAFIEAEQDLDQFENGTDEAFEIYGIDLKISDMFFFRLTDEQEPNEIGIEILIRNYVVHRYNPRLQEVVDIILEYLIGEKSFRNDIAYIRISQLESTYSGGEPLDLYLLRDYLIYFRLRLQFRSFGSRLEIG